MKTRLFVAVFVSVASIACERTSAPAESAAASAQTSAPAFVEAQPVHLWKDSDLEVSKLQAHGVTPQTSVKVVRAALPFLQNPPVQITQRFSFFPGSLGDMRHEVIVQEFADFTNSFVYADDYADVTRGRGLAIGAKTTDRSGNVVAEARLKLPLTSLEQFEIHEAHYDKDGRLTFSSHSIFDGAGIKAGEANTRGRKLREYYALWPTMLE